jgi:dipeptidyl aminopeptidase/acylaminoacyl peptidase
MTTDSTEQFLSVEQILEHKNVSDVQVAPTADRVAFVLSPGFKLFDESAHSRIWIVGLTNGRARVFTSGPRSDKEPRWSPDGKRLVFSSDRIEKGKHQLYVIDADAGEARLIVDTPAKATQPAWSPDGRYVAFVMPDPETAEEKERKAQHDDALVVDRDLKFDRLCVADVSTGTWRQVSQGPFHIWEFDWSPDGAQFVALTAPRPGDDGWFDAELSIVPATGGEPRRLIKTGKQFAMPRWSPNGQYVAYISCTWSDPGLCGGDLFVIDPRNGVVRNITEGERLSVSCFTWMPDASRILFMSHTVGNVSLNEVDLADKSKREHWSGAFTFSERSQPKFSACRLCKTIAVAREDPLHPRDIWIWSAATGWNQITRLQPAFESIRLGETVDVHWSSRDHRRIQGLLIRPAGSNAKVPLPTIVQVHGGPANVWPHRLIAGWHDWGQLLAARGYAVFLPNFRGSFGWGTEFTEANLGDMGGGDFYDIMTGLDHLIDQGISDPERLGICGWSYGGFMAAWAITQSNRFRAAVMGAGITNWISFHGTAEISSWDKLFWRDNPHDWNGRYARFSPMAHVQHARTPTLIAHGANDCCVPVTQSQEFYRALRDMDVPVELVIYPREGHGIQEQSHQRDLLNRIVAWFDRWMH